MTCPTAAESRILSPTRFLRGLGMIRCVISLTGDRRILTIRIVSLLPTFGSSQSYRALVACCGGSSAGGRFGGAHVRALVPPLPAAPRAPGRRALGPPMVPERRRMMIAQHAPLDASPARLPA